MAPVLGPGLVLASALALEETVALVPGEWEWEGSVEQGAKGSLDRQDYHR